MNKIYALLSATCILLFALLTIAVKYDKTSSLDFDTTVRIQDNTPHQLKPYGIKIVQIGSWQIMSAITAITMVIYRNNWWKIAIAYLIITVIEIYGKHELIHPPPPQFMLLRFEHLNLPQYHVRDINSYPSGHAARSAFLMMIWIPFLYQTLIRRTKSKKETKLLQKQNLTRKLPHTETPAKTNNTQAKKIHTLLRILAFVCLSSGITLCVSIIGFTKIYIGEHWTSDVIAGWLLGSAGGLITHITINHKYKIEKTKQEHK